MAINITATEIITSTIIYGFVHTFWISIKWGLRHLETDAGKIINKHVKDGHHARLTHCVENGCAKFGIVLEKTHQVKSQLE